VTIRTLSVQVGGMKSVKIEIIGKDKVDLIVQCDCGNCTLIEKTSGKKIFSHKIKVGVDPKRILACTCGKEYEIQTALNGINVS